MSDAWVALAGTAVGAVLSYAFQRLNMNRSEDVSKRERLRVERMTVYSEFASALFEYRRAQVRRYHLALSDSGEHELELAETESRIQRSRAWTAFYRLDLLTDDSQVIEAADRALSTLRHFHSAADTTAHIDQHSKRARDEIDEFVKKAKSSIPS